MLQIINVSHRSQLHSMCAGSLNQRRFIFTLTPLPAIRQLVSPALANAMWPSAFRQRPVYLETCFNFRLRKSLQPHILGHVLCVYVCFPPLFYKGRYGNMVFSHENLLYMCSIEEGSLATNLSSHFLCKFESKKGEFIAFILLFDTIQQHIMWLVLCPVARCTERKRT